MRLFTLMTTTLVASAAWAAPATLNVKVDGIARNDDRIPAKYALCQPSADGKSKDGENLRPGIQWSGAPAATRSFAVVVKDPDVPADFSDAGKDGKIVQKDAKRQLFYHWALADIPAEVTKIPGDQSSNAPDFGVKASSSLEKYVADATQYGGPCPPWNDERIHHYHFTVYALDVDTLKLPMKPTAVQVEKAVEGHVLASGSVTGTYTLNPSLKSD